MEESVSDSEEEAVSMYSLGSLFMSFFIVFSYFLAGAPADEEEGYEPLFCDSKAAEVHSNNGICNFQGYVAVAGSMYLTAWHMLFAVRLAAPSVYKKVLKRRLLGDLQITGRTLVVLTVVLPVQMLPFRLRWRILPPLPRGA